MATIRFERNGAIGRIILGNPPFNRLDGSYLKNLRIALHEASMSDIRVLAICAEGPNFSLGGEVRDTRGRNSAWFRTYVSEINSCYHEIEALRVPTVAVVRGMAFGGGLELALSCDFLVVADDALLCCVEISTGMFPVAGALQRLADRVGRTQANRIIMLGEPIPGAQAAQLGVASHVTPDAELDAVAEALIGRLAEGPTRAYASIRAMFKAWSGGGVPQADAVMIDLAADLYDTQDAIRGFAHSAKAFDEGVPPTPIAFEGK